MATLIVIPHRDMMPAIASSSETTGPQRPDQIRDVHGAQAEAIHQFVSTTIRPGASSRSRRATPYTVLGALGMLLVDERHVQRGELESTYGATVFENAAVAAVAPVAAPSTHADPPDRWHLDKINIAAMRDQGLTGSGGIVGVLDSGIAGDHPEFVDKNIAFAQFDKNGQQIDGAPTKDFGSHGSHVSGLVAGRTVGVAPDADLAVAAVLTVRGEDGYLAQILGGLNWLTQFDFRGDSENPGVHLVNASLEVRPFNDFLLHALEAAGRAPGTLVVAASGNDGSAGVNHVASPGNYAAALGVGSTDIDDAVASFSDWGEAANTVPKPDLVAPGVSILSSVPGNQYQRMSGTSMSSGIVCGAAALLIEKDQTLAHDPVRLKAELLRMVLPVPSAPQRAGSGRLAL